MSIDHSTTTNPSPPSLPPRVAETVVVVQDDDNDAGDVWPSSPIPNDSPCRLVDTSDEQSPVHDDQQQFQETENREPFCPRDQALPPNTPLSMSLASHHQENDIDDDDDIADDDDNDNTINIANANRTFGTLLPIDPTIPTTTTLAWTGLHHRSFASSRPFSSSSLLPCSNSNNHNYLYNNHYKTGSMRRNVNPQQYNNKHHDEDENDDEDGDSHEDDVEHNSGHNPIVHMVPAVQEEEEPQQPWSAWSPKQEQRQERRRQQQQPSAPWSPYRHSSAAAAVTYSIGTPTPFPPPSLSLSSSSSSYDPTIRNTTHVSNDSPPQPSLYRQSYSLCYHYDDSNIMPCHDPNGRMMTNITATTLATRLQQQRQEQRCRHRRSLFGTYWIPPRIRILLVSLFMLWFVLLVLLWRWMPRPSMTLLSSTSSSSSLSSPLVKHFHHRNQHEQWETTEQQQNKRHHPMWQPQPPTQETAAADAAAAAVTARIQQRRERTRPPLHETKENATTTTTISKQQTTTKSTSPQQERIHRLPLYQLNLRQTAPPPVKHDNDISTTRGATTAAALESLCGMYAQQGSLQPTTYSSSSQEEASSSSSSSYFPAKYALHATDDATTTTQEQQGRVLLIVGDTTTASATKRDGGGGDGHVIALQLAHILQTHCRARVDQLVWPYSTTTLQDDDKDDQDQDDAFGDSLHDEQAHRLRLWHEYMSLLWSFPLSDSNHNNNSTDTTNQATDTNNNINNNGSADPLLVGPQLLSLTEWAHLPTTNTNKNNPVASANTQQEQQQGPGSLTKMDPTSWSSFTHIVYFAPAISLSSSSSSSSVAQLTQAMTTLGKLLRFQQAEHVLYVTQHDEEDEDDNDKDGESTTRTDGSSIFEPWMSQVYRTHRKPNLVHVQIPSQLTWPQQQRRRNSHSQLVDNDGESNNINNQNNNTIRNSQTLLMGPHVLGALVAAMQLDVGTPGLSISLRKPPEKKKMQKDRQEPNQNDNIVERQHNDEDDDEEEDSEIFTTAHRYLGGWTPTGPCEWCNPESNRPPSHIKSGSHNMNHLSLSAPLLPSCASECAEASNSDNSAGEASCIPSVWQLELTRELTQECQVVLYTTVLPSRTDELHSSVVPDQPPSSSSLAASRELRVHAEYDDPQQRESVSRSSTNQNSVNETAAIVCNVAFVPRSGSALVDWVVSKVPNEQLFKFGVHATTHNTNTTTTIHEQKLDKLNGRLLYRGWILIWPSADPSRLTNPNVERNDNNLDWMTIKLTPKRFLADTVQHAVYVQADGGGVGASMTKTNKVTKITVDQVHSLVSNLYAPAQQSRMVRYGTKRLILPAEPERRAVLLASQLTRPTPSRRQQQQHHHQHHHRLSAREATKLLLASSTEPLVVKRHREVYHGLSKWLNPDPSMTMTHASQKTTSGGVGGGGGATVGVGNGSGGGGPMYRYDWESFLVDTSILVHDLQLGHDLRCEWYEQHLPSMLAESSLSSSLDGLTLAHVLALLDLRRRRAFAEPDDHTLHHYHPHGSGGMSLEQLLELKQHYTKEHEWIPLLTTTRATSGNEITSLHNKKKNDFQQWAASRYQFPVAPWNWDALEHEQEESENSEEEHPLPDSEQQQQDQKPEQERLDNPLANNAAPVTNTFVRILTTATSSTMTTTTETSPQ